ncbi:MAG: transposase [Cyclobacteriaceae bacterium]
MTFHPLSFYHIYNRGNNSQQIFFKDENYSYFLKKIRKHLRPHCQILAWCLMPNHFHLLIYTDSHNSSEVNSSEIQMAIATILRSYTRAINNQENRTGSLFQQKTKSKEIKDVTTCFHYIHQNPVRSKLVNSMDQWSFSSYLDYCGKRKGSLINRAMAHKYLDIARSPSEFEDESKKVIQDSAKDKFF